MLLRHSIAFLMHKASTCHMCCKWWNRCFNVGECSHLPVFLKISGQEFHIWQKCQSRLILDIYHLAMVSGLRLPCQLRPRHSTPSLAPSTLGVGPTGDACPLCPATHRTRMATRLTEVDTHPRLRVLEPFGAVPLQEGSMAHPPPLVKGQHSFLLEQQGGLTEQWTRPGRWGERMFQTHCESCLKCNWSSSDLGPCDLINFYF